LILLFSFFITLHETHSGLLQLKKKGVCSPRFSFYSQSPADKWKLLFVFISVLYFDNAFSQSSYSATGKASFYAKKFEGRNTASGEKFSNKNFTAAHRTLPFGTLVKVTNLSNSKTVVVRINDRGPFIKGRIIDLARIAADSLDFIQAGWAMVKVEEVFPIIVDTAFVLRDTSLFRFPLDWLGNWQGDLKVYTATGLKQVVPMELHILPTALPDRFSWIISYDSLLRNYELVVRDSLQKIYSLDEKNGIDISSSLLSNHFLSRFFVEGQFIESEYTLQSKDEMTFEIHAGNNEHEWSTGNVFTQNDSIPKVEVFTIRVLQIAALHRMKE